MRNDHLNGDPEYSFRSHGLSFPHLSAIYPLTYKIPLSYTPTAKKGILINISVCDAM
jgi:hypothetical protein